MDSLTIMEKWIMLAHARFRLVAWGMLAGAWFLIWDADVQAQAFVKFELKTPEART